MPRLASLLLALALVTACDDAPSSDEVPVRSLETLRLSALSVRVDDATLDVSAEAWRSFQPTVGERKEALLTLVRVRSSGGAIPSRLTLSGIYLMRGDEVFAAHGKEEEPRAAGARFAEFMVRDGPPWVPGDSIDVVVALTDQGATTLLLRAPRIAIARVD